MAKRGVFRKLKILVDQDGNSLKLQEGKYGWSASIVSASEDAKIAEHIVSFLSRTGLLAAVLAEAKKKKSKLK